MKQEEILIIEKFKRNAEKIYYDLKNKFSKLTPDEKVIFNELKDYFLKPYILNKNSKQYRNIFTRSHHILSYHNLIKVCYILEEYDVLRILGKKKKNELGKIDLQDLLLEAIYHDDQETFIDLLQNPDVDITQQYSDGNNIFHIACKFGSLNVAKIMMQSSHYQNLLNAKKDKQFTPFLY